MTAMLHTAAGAPGHRAPLAAAACSTRGFTRPLQGRRPCLGHRRQQQAPPRPLLPRAATGSVDEARLEEAGSTTSPPRMDPEEELQQLRTVDRIEVGDPMMEARGESAALAVIAAVIFGAGVWATMGEQKGQEYFAGYLLEQSLSVDNLFVFILVFKYFKTPLEYQSKVLTYGIATAAVLRLVMIVLGVDIVERFEPVLLLFAGILIYSSYKLLLDTDEDEDEDLSNNKIVKFVKSVTTFSSQYDGDRFFTTLADGTRVATPLLLVLAVVELSDVVFAVDSIPAVFGVTLDPFIIYTSNIFAILSLRGLYSFVSGVMSQLRYLDKAVALVLGFVGAKILLDYGGWVVPTDVSLAVVATILAGGVGASLLPGAAAEEEQS